MAEFYLAKKGWVSTLLIEQEAFSGVKKVAQKLQGDILEVTDQLPVIYERLEQVNEYLVLAGTYGKSPLIEKLEQEGKLDLSQVKGKREVYQIAIVEQPFEQVKQALVICGSDKRGTIYGLFQISEWMGVSPWIYWADVKPSKQEEVVISLGQPYTSKEPSVKYRGFFINDEWPSFGTWTFKQFGGFTAEMYDKVFELLLRLKGNYLWPAMWSSSFSLDGPGLKSAELADEYGVIMGQSHHEPCLRASEEWDIYKGKDTGYGLEWNYYTNKEGLINYWRDGLKRSGKYESVITIGMRGERDSSMLGEDATLKENIDLLKDIITEQRKLIGEYVHSDLDQVPQMLALYKEVEAYFYGDDQTEGLKDWDELEGVILMLCEDNFGNMRTLPEASKKDRKGGWGMYYHFDYHGAPISYEWVNSTYLTKVWEQMSMAYDYGIHELWIVNVGDLKPQELPLSYFMALAYDFDQWGTGAINKTHDFTTQWVKQQFGDTFLAEEQEAVVEVLEGYTRLNARCKPEVLSAKTYHPTRYHEADRILNEIVILSEKAETLLKKVSSRLYDAYYELVYFPAMASFNLIKMQIFSGMNHKAALEGKVMANVYADRILHCIEEDERLTKAYHHIGEGKWDGMASSAHIGFTHWNDEDWRYPVRQLVEPVEKARMIVTVDEVEGSFTGGYKVITKEVCINSDFTKTSELTVTLDNGGKLPYTYEIISDAKWLQLSKAKGEVDVQDQITVTFMAEEMPQTKRGMLHIKGADTMVQLMFEVKYVALPVDPMCFLECNGYVAIEAEHFAKQKSLPDTKWCMIEDYGRTLSGLKVFPTTVSFSLEEEAPELIYEVAIKEAGDYVLEVQCSPSNPLKEKGRLRYGLKVNEQPWQAVDLVAEDFRGGNWSDRNWCMQVLENINRSYTKISLREGKNKLCIKAMDAGVVLQRLLIYPQDHKIESAYLGPEESAYMR